MGSLGTTLKVSLDAKKVQRGLANLGTQVAAFGKRVAQMGLATAVGGFAALTAGVIAFTKSSSDSAAEMESMRAAFAVLTGSAEKAKDILEEIRKFGAETPLEQKDLQDAAKTLLAFGVNLKDVMPTLRMLGDVSAGDAQRLKSLALVFGQVASAGKLTGGDLLQLVNVGFNPLNEIAKRTGKSMSELRDMMSKGQITTAMVRQAFEDATGAGGMFNGMLAKMADTTEGKLSNMRDGIEQLKVAFGTGFNDGLKAALDAVNSALPKMLERFKAFGDQIGAAIAQAVSGNTAKLEAIGAAIGTILSEAAKKAFRSGARGIGTKVLEGLDAGENWIRDATGLSSVMGRSDLGARAAAAGDVVGAYETRTMMNAIRRSLDDIANTNGGVVPGTDGKWRYAGPNEQSAFSDAAGNKVIQVLKNIEGNTRQGAKF